MRYYLTVSILFLFGCNNVANQSTENNYQKENLEVKPLNDSFCNSIDRAFYPSNIELLSACDIVYNDSLSERTRIAFGGGRLSDIYNFNKGDPFLKYTKKGDTIEIKLLRIVKFRNVRMVMDTMFWDRDTLHLSERGQVISKDGYLPEFECEEFFYRFRLKDNLKNYYFYHKLPM